MITAELLSFCSSLKGISRVKRIKPTNVLEKGKIYQKANNKVNEVDASKLKELAEVISEYKYCRGENNGCL